MAKGKRLRADVQIVFYLFSFRPFFVIFFLLFLNLCQLVFGNNLVQVHLYLILLEGNERRLRTNFKFVSVLKENSK